MTSIEGVLPPSKILANKYAQEYFTLNFGEDSVKIVKAANSEMTDEALATKCKMKVSEIRSVLNKLHNARLATYVRSKDKDTGWYSYVWRVQLNGLYNTIEQSMKEEVKMLERQLETSTTVFSFYCPKCSRENKIDFDMASDLKFRCPSCRKQLKEVKANQQTLMEMIHSLRRKNSDFRKTIKEMQMKLQQKKK
jgi:transcription initiation factor TFIIE subunit alpha